MRGYAQPTQRTRCGAADGLLQMKRYLLGLAIGAAIGGVLATLAAGASGEAAAEQIRARAGGRRDADGAGFDRDAP